MWRNQRLQVGLEEFSPSRSLVAARKGDPRVRWGTFKLGQFKPLGFQNWLKSLEVNPKTKGHLKAFVDRLFNKAKLYGMLEFQENPIALVEVRGISKRSRRPADLTIDEFFLILRLVPKS